MLSAICNASSRVGLSISARSLFFWFNAAVLRSLINCNKGKVNAAVLPVPVCADASTSLPWRMAGIDLTCISVGVKYPFFSSDFNRLSPRFKSLNDILFFIVWIGSDKTSKLLFEELR